MFRDRKTTPPTPADSSPPNKRLKTVKEERAAERDTKTITEVWASKWLDDLPNGDYLEALRDCQSTLKITQKFQDVLIRDFFKECALAVRCVDTSYVLTPLRPHFGQVLAKGRDINPNAIPDKRIRAFFDYSNMTIDERKQRLKNESVFVKNHNDEHLWIEEKIRLERFYQWTDILKDRWCYGYEGDEELWRRSFQRAVKYLDLSKEDLAEVSETFDPSIVLPKELEEYKDKQVYKAPEKRLRITHDISWLYDTLFRFRVPVYSDIPDDTPANIIIPDTLCFDSLRSNIIDKLSEPLLREAVELAEEEPNHIKCGCVPGVDSCFENPECACYKMNIALRKMNNVENNHKTVFCSTESVFYMKDTPDFYEHAAFSCSDICGCKGECNNNVTLVSKERICPLEVYRENHTVGFGVRSTAFIPAGIPILEFTGEVMKAGRLKEELKSYAMQMADPKNDQNLMKVVTENSGFSKEYLKKLNYIYKKTSWHIDCKWQGNVSRFIMNSCTPNLEPIRVFQKSFSPAHCKVLLFTNKSLCPGEPLSLDYGPNYYSGEEEAFKCQCGSFACKNGPHAKIFSKMEPAVLAECFAKLHNGAIDHFKALLEREESNNDGKELLDADTLRNMRIDECEHTEQYLKIYNEYFRFKEKHIWPFFPSDSWWDKCIPQLH